jgi:hypothetical protein
MAPIRSSSLCRVVQDATRFLVANAKRLDGFGAGAQGDELAGLNPCPMGLVRRSRNHHPQVQDDAVGQRCHRYFLTGGFAAGVATAVVGSS